jgi:DNA-binding response OmpR family regulator
MVEDELEIRQLACGALTSGGHHVIVACSPGQAIELAHSASVDLLVTGVLLPLMSGLAMAIAIRQRRPFLPVLFLADYPTTPPYGLSACIRKPFTPNHLVGAAESLLARSARCLP